MYTLAEHHAEVTASTLRLYSNSATSSLVRGNVFFDSGRELRIFEYIDWAAGEILSYTVYSGEEKVRWYDPQPHPEDAALASTFPHHYHTAPDIKHHRVPAPGISFADSNLPTLIADCIGLGRVLSP